MKFTKHFSFFFLIIFIVACANPIDKKKKQLENCKVTLDSVKIQKYQLLIIPPVPKIYFKANLNVENLNEEEVTIQKFDFKMLTNYKGKDNTTLATAKSTDEYLIQPYAIQKIELDLVTTLEDNSDKQVFGFVGDIIGSLLGNKEMEFLLQGNVHFETMFGKISIPFNQVFKTKVRP
jgi:hypothetical protein